jgi:predicted transcriptional regulator
MGSDGSRREMSDEPELTDRELEVMQAFWEHGEATAMEIRDRLAKSGLDRAYVTIANLIRQLHQKGLLRQTNEQRPFSYVAGPSFEEISRGLVGDLLERVFGGARDEFFARLLEQRRLTAKERAALEKILEEHKR